MGYQTSETMRMTCDSYIEAVKQVEQFCPRFSLFHHNGGSPQAIKLDLKSDWSSVGPFLDKVTRVWAIHDSLFDIGSPKQVSPSWSLWGQGFFRVSFHVDVSFTEYEWEYGIAESRDDDGNIITPAKPACIVERSRAIDFYHEGRKWGLCDWKRKADEIRTYCDNCPPAAREQYLVAYKAANDEVLKWEQAINAARSVTIPE